MVFLTFLCWVAVGLLAGFIARKFVDLRGDDPRLAIAVAVGGAIVAGVFYSIIAGAGLSVWSILFSAAGGAAGAVIWHRVRSRSISRQSYTSRNSYS